MKWTRRASSAAKQNTCGRNGRFDQLDQCSASPCAPGHHPSGAGGAERVAFNLIADCAIASISASTRPTASIRATSDSRCARSLSRSCACRCSSERARPIKLGGMVLAGYGVPKLSSASRRTSSTCTRRFPNRATLRWSRCVRAWGGFRSCGRSTTRSTGIPGVSSGDGATATCRARSSHACRRALLRHSSSFAPNPVPVRSRDRLSSSSTVLWLTARGAMSTHAVKRHQNPLCGRFEDQKGADLLPSIVNAVSPPDGRTCELVIHGSGTHEPALRLLSTNPPPGWRIEISRPVPNLSRRMPQFDLLIMPSRYEGLP